MLKYLLKEPLLYFFAIAAVLFVVNHQSQEREEQIVVDAATISYLYEQRSQLQYNSLESELKQQLVDQYIDNEVLYREAINRGLENDSRIRKLLVQKIILLLSKDIPEPDEQQLRDYYEQNKSRFVQPETRDFDQVFFMETTNIQEDFLDRLQTDESAARSLGTPSSLFGPQMTRKSEQELMLMMGKEAVKSIMTIDDSLWHGPIRSKQGVHFVRLVQIHPATPEEFSRIKRYLAQEWMSAQHESQINQAVKALRSQYQITIDWPKS